MPPAAGIHRLAVPTPFAVGRVNAYLIEGEPLTLVDTGPNSGTSFDALERGVADAGHALEEIELVLLTHHHGDHLGLLSIVAARSGAEVAAIEAAVPFVEGGAGEGKADDEFTRALMIRHGVPEEMAVALEGVSQIMRAWGSTARVTRPLRDGEALELGGRTLHVHHRPGHSPTDTVFHDREARVLIAGDHLLGHISSNPLVTRPRDGSSERPQALVDYLGSLAATRDMDFEVALPGHGEPVTGAAELIDQRVRLHRRRADKILRVVAERPRSAYEIARELWREAAATQAYLTLSEVLGHLDLLLNDGRARELDRNGRSVFQAA